MKKFFISLALLLGACDTLPYGDTGETGVPECTTEVCNGVDDDCNGLEDELNGVPGALCNVPDDTVVCYANGDGDGHTVGSPQSYPGTVCPVGTTPTPSAVPDCNDGNAAVHPGATEVCNDVDDDCDGSVDDGVATVTFYPDVDNDGYGWAYGGVSDCVAPAGFVGNDDDCDDTDPRTRPEQYEVCNDLDDNCDGQIDNMAGGATCAAGTDTCFRDADGDGSGTHLNTRIVAEGASCPAGYIPENHDCDDGDARRTPGKDELCTDNIDNNCDAEERVNEGCPTTPVCTPTGAEICGNTVDEDCSGGANACPVCIPTGVEVCGNTVDEDCNASTSDTCPVCVVTGPELCGNGVNEDCNATTSDICPVTPTKACYEDRDGDGYGANGRVTQRTTCLSSEADVGGDCEDGDALRFPELMEVHDLRDNDCDGQVDEDGLVIYNRYHRTAGTVDWDHLFATSTPAGGYAQDDKWIGLYPTNICSGTYRPFDTCTVNANGSTVTLHGGNQLEALSQCRGMLDGKDVTLPLLEGSGEFRDYSVLSGFSCSRLGYAMSLTGSARSSFGSTAKLFYRHRSAPFTAFGGARAGVADNMWSTLPTEGQELSDDVDYDEHGESFLAPKGK